MKKFEPTVVAFSCMFCAQPAPAGSRLKFISLHCLGKLDARHVLQALENGADAVLVAGGITSQCRFIEGLAAAQKKIEYTRTLLSELGIEPERLELVAAGRSIAEAAAELTEQVRALGPSPLMKAKKQHKSFCSCQLKVGIAIGCI
jgi:coenzyme F420-reducing hydrogenase delta subunit